MKSQLKIGDKLFLVEHRRGGCHAQECIVSKVGRKYFSVKINLSDYFEHEFKLEDWTEHAEYAPTYSIYQNEQEYKDCIEKHKKYSLIRKAICGFYSCPDKLDLHNVNRIYDILSVNGLIDDSSK